MSRNQNSEGVRLASAVAPAHAPRQESESAPHLSLPCRIVNRNFRSCARRRREVINIDGANLLFGEIVVDCSRFIDMLRGRSTIVDLSRFTAPGNSLANLPSHLPVSGAWLKRGCGTRRSR